MVCTFLSLLEILKQVHGLAVDELCSYTIPPETMDTSNAGGLRAFPPPLFSRQAIPQGYKFVPSKGSFNCR